MARGKNRQTRAQEIQPQPAAEAPRYARACSFVARQALVYVAQAALSAALQYTVDVPFGTDDARALAWHTLANLVAADAALGAALLAFAAWRGAPRPDRAALVDGTLVALSYAACALVTRLRGLTWYYPRAELCGAAVALVCWRISGLSRDEALARWREPWLAGWCALRALASFGYAPVYVVALLLFGLYHAWRWFKSSKTRS